MPEVYVLHRGFLSQSGLAHPGGDLPVLAVEGFSIDDLDHMVSDGDIVMTCEFCNLDFRFNRDEVRGQADPKQEG